MLQGAASDCRPDINTSCSVSPLIAYLADHCKVDTLKRVLEVSEVFAAEHNSTSSDNGPRFCSRQVPQGIEGRPILRSSAASC